MGIHDVDATLLIQRTAEELKKDANIKPPVWAAFAKTGAGRERAPVQHDWWFVRSAAILRKLFILGPVGTSKLKVKFGGRKNRGMEPDCFYPGAGNHIRKILQQLEKAGLAKQVQKGVHKGRIASPQGQRLLESVASQIMTEKGIVLPAKPKEEPKAAPEAAEEKPKKAKKPRAPRKKKAPAEKPAEAASEKPAEKSPEVPKENAEHQA